MRDVDLAYAAGIIDGEGCICLSVAKSSGQLNSMVTVRMVDQEVPRWLAETFGGALYECPRQNERSKETTMWRVIGRAGAAFCAEVRPFLRVKQRQADLLIALHSDDRYTCKPGLRVSDEQRVLRADYAQRMRALNARGVSDACS